MRCWESTMRFFTPVGIIPERLARRTAFVDGFVDGPGLARAMNVSSPFRIRGVATVLLAFVLLGAAPVSLIAAELQSSCAATQHQCDAPSISHCCCVDFGGGSAPATSERGPEPLGGPALIAPTAAMTCGLVFVFPPEAWSRVCSRAARPPLPLHLLNVSILR